MRDIALFTQANLNCYRVFLEHDGAESKSQEQQKYEVQRPSDRNPPVPDVQKTETNPQHASTNSQRKTAVWQSRNRIRTL